MAKMGSYCKIYPATNFRRFSGWTEKVPPMRIPKEGNQSDAHTADGSIETDCGYFYLQEDYTVTAGIFLDEDVTFDTITPEWKRFCHEELNFSVPEDARPDVVLFRSERGSGS